MPLDAYQRFAYRLLGPYVEESADKNISLKLSLLRAHIFLRPDVYLAYSYLNLAIVFGVALLGVGTLAGLAYGGYVTLPSRLMILLLPLPVVLALFMYLLIFLIPNLKASGRSRDITARLPYALSYISTMASAGIPPERIFAGLARQRIYGEVADEAAGIARDLGVLGRDLVTALTAAIDRSPSINFQDFLQGAITAMTSGEDLKAYFLAKSQQYVYENRQEQKKFLENLGILAESYITVVVAAPVFLIVLLSVMVMIGGNARRMIRVGYALVLLLIPMAQALFAATIASVTPKE